VEAGGDLQAWVLGLFNERGAAYSLKELRKMVGAPDAEVREILELYCEYQKKGKDRTKWTLRAEYGDEA
jgi:hypothetical protein